MIPPAISNWKNNKGYTIPLDKRLAADGSGIKDLVINDNFAQFAEALSLADRHAREEVRQRSIMQQKLAAKEKAAKEEHLRNLAQRAREERAGISSATPSVIGRGEDDDDVASRLDDSDAPTSSRNRAAAAGGGGMSAMLAGYGSDSDSNSSRSSAGGKGSDDDEGSEDEVHANAIVSAKNDAVSENVNFACPTWVLNNELSNCFANKIAIFGEGSLGTCQAYRLQGFDDR